MGHLQSKSEIYFVLLYSESESKRIHKEIEYEILAELYVKKIDNKFPQIPEVRCGNVEA